MLQSVRMTAEEQFAATQRKAKIVLNEKEQMQQERAEQIARLKVLRLEKEAADHAEAVKVTAKEK